MAFATNNGDTSVQKLDNSGNKLDWYLANATAQVFEAFVYINTGGVATEAHTFAPVGGPFHPLGSLIPPSLSISCQDLGQAVCQLDFSVMYNTLAAVRTGNLTPPRGGHQWWVGLSDHGPEPFPISVP